MKKVVCVVAVLAMGASLAVAQETLEVRIVDSGGNSSVSVAANDTVDIVIQGRLNTTSSDGLALWGINLTTNGSTYSGYDLCVETSITEGALMGQFVKNNGLTNPAGYGGTCSGAGTLWQIGGGQNTIANTDPPAYPVGTVDIGIANGTGWTNLAVDTITVPADIQSGDSIVLALDTCFANTIDPGQAGPVYSVTAANCSIVGDLTLSAGFAYPECSFGTSTATCPNADVNCDNIVTGLDVSIIKSSANFGKTAETAANGRADVNRDGTVTGLDVSIAQGTACFGQ